jgi:hypothetical protein
VEKQVEKQGRELFIPLGRAGHDIGVLAEVKVPSHLPILPLHLRQTQCKRRPDNRGRAKATDALDQRNDGPLRSSRPAYPIGTMRERLNPEICKIPGKCAADAATSRSAAERTVRSRRLRFDSAGYGSIAPLTERSRRIPLDRANHGPIAPRTVRSRQLRIDRAAYRSIAPITDGSRRLRPGRAAYERIAPLSVPDPVVF